MSEGRAVKLMGTVAVILGAGAWLAVALLTDDGALATVAMFIVGGIGIDQMSRVGMRYDRR
ncbi:MAG TPA: hypothetical protein VD761_10455 [Solirubrobacterales bacterium]|nr:hypothetical protein [Solirubrobacterales bacterium]